MNTEHTSSTGLILAWSSISNSIHGMHSVDIVGDLKTEATKAAVLPRAILVYEPSSIVSISREDLIRISTAKISA